MYVDLNMLLQFRYSSGNNNILQSWASYLPTYGTYFIKECKGRRTTSQFDRCSHVRMHEEMYNPMGVCTYFYLQTYLCMYSYIQCKCICVA